jgi:hypothetical protein
MIMTRNGCCGGRVCAPAAAASTPAAAAAKSKLAIRTLTRSILHSTASTQAAEPTLLLWPRELVLWRLARRPAP